MVASGAVIVTDASKLDVAFSINNGILNQRTGRENKFLSICVSGVPKKRWYKLIFYHFIKRFHVGDSIVNKIDARGLGKQHSVQVKSYGGGTSTDMKDFIKPNMRKKHDGIILHIGTNLRYY